MFLNINFEKLLNCYRRLLSIMLNLLFLKSPFKNVVIFLKRISLYQL